MKTRHQLLILFSSACILLLVTAYLLLSVTSHKNNILLNDGEKELKDETNKVISLISLGVENWVFDNTYWDELVNAFKKKDSIWVRDNYVAIDKFGVNYLWLIKTDGTVFYNSLSAKKQKGDLFFMNIPLLLDSLRKHPFKHFFVQFNNETVEIFTAPVQPSIDTTRTAPHRGYFIAGQSINTKYFEKLSMYTGANQYELLTQTDSTNKVNTGKNSIVSYTKTFAGFNNKPLQLLKVTKKLDVLNTYKNDLRAFLLTFICIVLAIFMLVYYFFSRKILLPLHILSRSLENKDPAVLNKLIPKKNEFAALANLICNFFNQNKLLQDEIETRIVSERELKKTAKELQLQTIRAEQSQVAKADFLSTMSHEIRTPINGVIGISNLLMEEELTVKQKEYVKILNFSSLHLLSIISDILDFSKIESGKLQFDKALFNLKNTCLNVISLFEAKAQEKNIRFIFEPEENISGSLYGDSVRLCQVLTNLLSNAIKFTNKGHVKLSYKSLIETNSHCTIKFTVEDTGIGISGEQREKIFESFTQANRSISSKYGGTGLGLTISKKLVEMQGGKIELVSETGKGSSFTFYLSFEKHTYTDSPVTPQKTVPAVNNLQSMKILVVEDNHTNAFVLNSFLKKWNIQTELAKNGQEALNKLEEAVFDVVLMDIQMPVMDGKEATRIIRTDKQKKYHNIPVIALTADATSETRQSIDDFGFTHYLSKPFNPDVLYRMLTQYYKLNEN